MAFRICLDITETSRPNSSTICACDSHTVSPCNLTSIWVWPSVVWKISIWLSVFILINLLHFPRNYLQALLDLRILLRVADPDAFLAVPPTGFFFLAESGKKVVTGHDQNSALFQPLIEFFTADWQVFQP